MTEIHLIYSTLLIITLICGFMAGVLISSWWWQKNIRKHGEVVIDGISYLVIEQGEWK